MNLLKDVIDMYQAYGLEVPFYYQSTYEKMKDYLVYVLKPNNMLPCLGDTHLLSRKWYFKDYGTENLLFVDTRSKKGERPINLDKIYPEAGYAIFREDWGDIKSYDKMTYFIQTVSNASKVHKHSDYLSFELYSNGEDLIVDAGHGGYQKNDTVTYLKSTLAHNTLSIDNTNYDFQIVSEEDAGIYDSSINNEVSYARSYFRPFGKGILDKEIELQRSVFFIKPNIFVIYDRGINLNGKKQFQQFFNFGKNLQSVVNEHLDKTYLLDFERTSLTIKQLDEFNEIKYFYGKDTTLRGLIADGPLKIRKGVQIEFVKPVNEHQEQFITILHVHKKDIDGNQKKEIDLSDISVKQSNEKLQIFLKGEKVVETNL